MNKLNYTKLEQLQWQKNHKRWDDTCLKGLFNGVKRHKDIKTIAKHSPRLALELSTVPIFKPLENRQGEPVISEQAEQAKVMQFLSLINLPFTHIANEAPTSAQRIKNAINGVRAGASDLFIALPFGALFIEMKKQKGYTITTEQREWIREINLTSAGCFACVCCGADVAIKLIDTLRHIEGANEWLEIVDEFKNGDYRALQGGVGA